MDSTENSLTDRIQRLEDIEAIRSLKARYWHRCDMKDVEGVRECFADGPISIRYDGTGSHAHRDSLYDLFAAISLHENIVELHHGGPPQIDIDGDSATGIWSLSYHLMDTNKGTIHVVGGYYSDEYRREASGWRIVKTDFSVCSNVGYRWHEETLRVLAMGRSLSDGNKSAPS